MGGVGEPLCISVLYISVRRRPIAKELFLEQFWWCHRRLADKSDAEYGMAAYFRFLTLVGEQHSVAAPFIRRLHLTEHPSRTAECNKQTKC